MSHTLKAYSSIFRLYFVPCTNNVKNANMFSITSEKCAEITDFLFLKHRKCNLLLKTLLIKAVYRETLVSRNSNIPHSREYLP